MKPIRMMAPAAVLLAAALTLQPPTARAQSVFYGQGVTDYSYTGFNSSYGSYGFGGVGPWYYNQNMTAGGITGIPYGGVYVGSYGGMYGGMPYGGMPYGPAAFPNDQMMPHGRMPMGNFGGYGGHRAGGVGGVVPYVPRLNTAVPRLNMSVPQLSPRVPPLR